jgi:Zn ribbon nucleic-acid-binding protein
LAFAPTIYLLVGANSMFMQTKICPTCKVEKTTDQYTNNKIRKDGLQRECRECCHLHNSKHYHTKKSVRINENLKPKHKICSYCNNEIPFEQFNKLKLGRFGLKGECKICEKIRDKQYRNNNKEKLNQYRKNKKATDPQFKLKHILRLRLLDALKRDNITKRHSALELLGCSIEQCKYHIESQFKPEMNWSNHGSYWEIDHIIPCNSFDLIDIEQQKQCFYYTNLQPLTIYENRSKKNRIMLK